MLDDRRVFPRLANDAIFLPHGRGTLFRNDANAFILDEDGSYELMRGLAPRLTGTSSLDDICHAHRADLRPTIARLVRLLIDYGILRNDSHHSRRLPADVRTRFAAQVALLDHLADAPEERFDWFRQSRVLLMGSGLAFGACAAALRRNGLESLFTKEDDDDRDERLSMVLCITDSLCLSTLKRACHRALRDRGLILFACVLDDQAWLGPLMRAPACGICAFRRVSVGLWKAGALHRLPAPERQPRDTRETNEALARRLGGDAAFEAFKALAGGVRPDLAGGVILQTATGPDTVRATFTPYTLHWCWGACRPCQPAARDAVLHPC